MSPSPKPVTGMRTSDSPAGYGRRHRRPFMTRWNPGHTHLPNHPKVQVVILYRSVFWLQSMSIEQRGDGRTELYNDLYRCLQKPNRRRILYRLHEVDSRDMVMVPEEVQRREVDYEELAIELVHSDLPLLEDAGLIRWDRGDNSVTRGPEFYEVEELLDDIQVHDPLST